MQTIRGVLAAAVLLVHLLVQAEGAKRTCPVISNFTTATIALALQIRCEEPALLLSVGFLTNDRSACQCSLHEVIRGRLKLKARANRCFGAFGVTVNEGMHRVSIECKKRRCPRVNETRYLDAKAIDCGHPGDIEKGNVTYSSTFAGCFATYSCNDGYQIDPPYANIRLCNQSGNWSGDIPTCVVDCGPPPEITNGTVFGVFTSVGRVASYLCDYPTNLVGNDTIVCRDDGTWDDPPMCVPRVDCGPPPRLANGSVRYFLTTLGSSARYSCNLGYNREGARSIFCNANGMWDQPPTCKLAE